MMDQLIKLGLLFFLTVTFFNADVSGQYEQYLQPNDVGRDKSFDTMKDDGVRCSRDCGKYNESRICYYEFTLEQYNAMGPACDNCSLGVEEDCYNPQCVPGDGSEKTILIVNRRFMGPGIQVCFNDTIIVKVHNIMPARDVAIHWHGVLQEDTPFMDGVPSVTQCPIAEGATFQYIFYARNSGTHFYHSHSALQEFEGFSGALIIRTPKSDDPNGYTYDFDPYSFVFHLSDWMHMMADDKYPGANRNASLIIQKADSYLVNGYGIYGDINDQGNVRTPITIYTVEQGYRYRFRIIGAGSQQCAAMITFQDHPMLLISTDGYDVVPVSGRTLWVRPGERFDIVINANQSVSSYMIYIQGTDICEGAHQYAILKYKGSDNELQSIPDPASLFTSQEGNDLNNVRSGCINNASSICMDEVRSLVPPPKGILADKPDVRFFFTLGGHDFSYQELYRTNTYHRHYLPLGGPTVTTVFGTGRIVTDTMNNISNMLPSSPVYTTPPDDSTLCPSNCTDFCECFNYLQLNYGDIVEMVLIDGISLPNGTIGVDHPMHLHGHHFWILKQGSYDELQEPNYYLNTVINPNNPEYTTRPNHRDTVSVPAAGFAVVRFVADNPGTWMFHCHFTVHLVNGMSVVFQIGDRSTFKPVPPNWPTCGDYVITLDDL